MDKMKKNYIRPQEKVHEYVMKGELMDGYSQGGGEDDAKEFVHTTEENNSNETTTKSVWEAW